MLVFSVIFYVVSVAAIVLLYIFFTEVMCVTSNWSTSVVTLSFIQLNSCSLNKFFISSTLVLSVIVSVVAILPWIQKGKT